MIRNDSDRYMMNITAANTIKASVRVQMVRLMTRMQQRWSHPLQPHTTPPTTAQLTHHQQEFWRRQAVWNAIHLLLSPPATIVHPVYTVVVA
ncbi:MAG: hypothetical protein SFY66_20305 [Oculatellaceae cyanobacterium bins.114]|nr:hypothetical protein [Oculatellaceae cyanobacterium bins.114]